MKITGLYFHILSSTGVTWQVGGAYLASRWWWSERLAPALQPPPAPRCSPSAPRSQRAAGWRWAWWATRRASAGRSAWTCPARAGRHGRERQLLGHAGILHLHRLPADLTRRGERGCPDQNLRGVLEGLQLEVLLHRLQSLYGALDYLLLGRLDLDLLENRMPYDLELLDLAGLLGCRLEAVGLGEILGVRLTCLTVFLAFSSGR